MITAEPLKIEKCANCGHDIMARMDMKILPGNVRRILIEISGKKEKEEGS